MVATKGLDLAAARFGCVAVVPAGGNGSRFGGDVPKQYSLINGVPVLEHTLRVLESFLPFEQIFVVVQTYDSLAADIVTKFPRTTLLRCAGETRAQTVEHGLREIAPHIRRDAWVAVHDAARPCVSEADIARLMQAIANHAVGGLLGLPIADTVKRAAVDGSVTETVPRDGLWRAQTPQVFRYETLAHALRVAPDVTDEAQAIEALGLSPLLVRGNARNIKITVPENAELAALYLAAAATALSASKSEEVFE